MCIVGGGPAGLVLGLLLARSGIDVVVLEKHSDFLRDFRGDTIHPTTLDLLDDLGLRDQLSEIPHTEVATLDVVINRARFTAADFTHVGRSGRLWFMPQWDLLNLLATTAQRYSSFRLLTDTTGLCVIDDGGRVVGVRADRPNGEFEIRADLVVAADGRDSAIRESAGLRLEETGVAVDVLWFRVDRPEENPPDTIIYISKDAVITVPRTDYYQCALLIPKGHRDEIEAAGLDAFHERIGAAVPFLADQVRRIDDWDDVKLLNVRIAHAPRWHRPGLMLIGDSAHPMSPAFGVGINYAIQDAVALARALTAVPASGWDESLLDGVQRRRLRPVRVMQRIQQAVHATVGRPQARRLPPTAVLRRVGPIAGAAIRRPLGRLVGAGFRPENWTSF